MARDITAQQRKFVQEYLRLRKRSQKQAALNAGYSAKSVDSQASQLLKNPKVLAYLAQQEEQLTTALQQEFIYDAMEARQVLHDIMSSKVTKDRDKIAVAKDFLDRAGFKV